MIPDDRLADLLERWEAAGGAASPEELCRDCPSDIPELRALLARLGRLGMMPGADSDDRPPDGFRAGRFVAVEYHAAGGLGWVYLGRDEELNRPVALKCMKTHTSEGGERFLAEAELTGRLAHPGIVPVHGRGRTNDGRPFYAMRFVDGPTLKDATRRFHDAPPGDAGERNVELRRLVRAVATVCETVAYAHSRGVIHRDLKPANVMLGSFGEVLVMDWGLAKELVDPERGGRVECSTTTDQLSGAPADTDNPRPDETRMGWVKGSPAFMSPEQARGDWAAVGPVSDIYSIGATLYYVITGRPPFDGRTPAQVVAHVREGKLLAPSEMNPTVPPSLDAICRRAMEQDRAYRYQSARDFATDLERWLADEPVSAWREPLAVRARRWVQRHRLAVTGTAAALVVGLAAAVGLATVQRQANTDLAAANRELDTANTGLAESNRGLVQSINREKTARTEVSRQKDRADSNLIRTQTTLHAVRMNSAVAALSNGQHDMAWSLVRKSLPEPGERHDPRGFEWYCAWHLFNRTPTCTIPGPTNPQSIAVSADGQRVASWGKAGEAMVLSVYDLPTGRRLKTFSGLFPRGDIPTSGDLTLFAVPERGGVRLWHFPSEGPSTMGQVLGPITESLMTVAVSRDGTLVAAVVGLGQIVVWKVADGRILHEFPAVKSGGSTQVIDRLCFSRDGTLLGTVRGLEAIVYDLHNGRASVPRFAARRYVNNLWFTQADTLFVTGGEDQIDARPLTERNQSPPDTPRKYPQAPRFLRGVWEEPDGDRGLLTVLVGDGLIRPYYSPFVRDGFRFVRDSLPVVNSFRRPGDPIPIPYYFPTPVAAFSLSPGGRTWAVGEADGTITVFPAPTLTDLGLSVPHPGAGAVCGVGFMADGGIVSQAQNLSVAAGPPNQPTNAVWTVPGSSGQYDFHGATAPAAGLIGSQDGRRVAYRLPKKTENAEARKSGVVLVNGVQVADAATGRHLTVLPVRENVSFIQPSIPTAFIPGREVVVYANPARGFFETRQPRFPLAAEVVTWDVTSGKAVATWPVTSWVRGIAVTADGRNVVAAAEDGRVRVWRVGRLEHDPIRTYRAAGELWSVAVSADGSKLAAGGFDGNVWVWETGRDEPTRTPMHRGIVHTLAFAPDGRSLVSGGHDGTVRFLDLELMQERFNVSSGSEARALVFSPDGSALAVAGNDGGVRLFRTTSPAGVVEDCRRRWAAAPKDATARRDLVAALWAFYLDRTRAKDSPGARRAVEEAAKIAEAAGDRADARAWLTELRAVLTIAD